MSQTPTRRLSTGGLPPVKIREIYVVEEAPSHDETPCYTAWIKVELLSEIPQGFSASDFSNINNYSRWSIPIYDTTPASDSPEYLSALAEALHRETIEERFLNDRGEPDRIDVWGIPLPTNTSEEERIAKCKAHFLAEVASRNASGNPEFYMPRLKAREKWQRAIVVIYKPQSDWNEDESSFLAVYWDLHPRYIEDRKVRNGEDYDEPDTSVLRLTRKELGSELAEFRYGIWISDDIIPGDAE